MSNSLAGIRIWLSGSIPKGATDEEKERIRKFVRTFAEHVFHRGGTLIHGTHPTITPSLIDAARKYKSERHDKAGLVLIISRYFSKDPEANSVEEEGFSINLEEWNALCDKSVIETREALPDATGNISRSQSLEILRDVVVKQCNAIVAIGGKWWAEAGDQSGVPKEIELARANSLPLFLLGGLGGSTREYLKQNLSILQSCNNGLSDAENIQLSEVDVPDELANILLNQISRLPLRTRTPQSGRPFRILCLDGGGIRGAFTAAVLDYWEQATGVRVVDHFDLIAGTSTGGILAIGLGMGMTAGDMLNFYINEGPQIFPVEESIGKLRHSFRHWFGAKFDQDVLKNKLEKAYKTAPIQSHILDDSLTRLVIPAYNTETDRLLLFRTPHGHSGNVDRGHNRIEVSLATAAAPTYFNPIKVGHALAVDGGVWANSPTSVALAEAIHQLNIEPDRIEMLSVGTTFCPSLEGQPILLDQNMIQSIIKPAVGTIPAKIVSLLWKPKRIQGKIGWLPNIAGFLMKTQAQTADFVCHSLLQDRYLRIDEATVATQLDGVDSIDRLIGLGKDIAQRHLPQVKSKFLNGLPVDSWK